MSDDDRLEESAQYPLDDSDPEASGPRFAQPSGCLLAAGLVWAGIVLLGMALAIRFVPILEMLEKPQRTSLRIVERELQASDLFSDEGGSSALAFLSTLEGDASDLEWASELLAEVHDHVDTPSRELLAAQAILALELDDRGTAESLLWQLELRDATWAAAVMAAYPDRPPHVVPPDDPGPTSGSDWFSRRLAAGQAEASGDTEAIAELAQANEGYERLVLQVYVWGAAISILFALFGFGALVWWLRRGRPSVELADGLVENAWPPRLGVTVFAWSLVLAFWMPMGSAGNDSPMDALYAWSTLVGAIPGALLVYAYLIRPQGRNLLTAFGLRIPRERWKKLAIVSAAVFGIDLCVTFVLTFTVGTLEESDRWAELVIEPMLWAPLPLATMMAIDGVLWAPLFEEGAFRGVLYPTLRTRLAPLASGAIVAVFFTVIHGYGILGSSMILASALIWAWSYEATRSLWPAILSHFAGNLLAIGSMMLLYR